MKFTKLTIIFIFLLAFAMSVSAQTETPKIIWKNLQESYESFYDIKPVIKNVSEEPVYFDCSPPDLDRLNTGIELWKFDEKSNRYFWNVMVCGTISKEERKGLKKLIKKEEKLKKQGKYVPAGCKINPNEEYAVNFTEEQWNYLIWGSFEAYKSGRFILKVMIETSDGYTNNYQTVESPEFVINMNQKK